VNIYVGNISLRLKESHLRELFEAFGEVTSVRILKDFNTGASRGTGFVEMKYEAEGKSAIDNLNRCDLDGKKMVVHAARETSNNKNRINKKRF
jgi:RNA recognition motif-containing protein